MIAEMSQEAAAENVDVVDIKPGDVIEIPGETAQYAVQKIYPHQREQTVWRGVDVGDAVEVIEAGLDGDAAEVHFYSSMRNKFVDAKVLWQLSGTKLVVLLKASAASAKRKKDMNTELKFMFDVGPHADKINSALQKMHDEWQFAGITTVQKIGVDQRFVIGPRTAPKGFTKAALILQVLINAGEPLSREEILMRVSKLEGKPFVPTSNLSYFAPGRPESLVSRGIIVQVPMSGRKVMYEPFVKRIEQDWRHDASIPEDYYAL